MERIRVLLANVAPLLGALLTSAARARPEVALVVACDPDLDLEQSLQETAPQVLVCRLADVWIEALLPLT